MKKIVFMTSGSIGSSISYRMLSIAKELVKNGYSVSIFSLRFDKYSNFKDEKISEIDGVKIIRPLQPSKLPFEVGLILYFLSSCFILLRLNPDIIHVSKSNPITLPAVIQRLIKKTPIIVDFDDADNEVMRIEHFSEFKIKLIELSEKILADASVAITTASKYLKNKYSSKYKNKLVVHIPNGAEFTNMTKISTKLISKNRIIFIGNINRINILEPLFLAIKSLKQNNPRISVRIIGDGQYLAYFKELSKRLKIQKSIKFLGKISQNLLSKYIAVGDIGYAYMPNELTIKACSSMKVFQYMQFGAIPLVSNVGDFPMSTFNGKAGYIVKHSNIQDLTNTITRKLNNQKEKRKKIIYSKIFAADKFSWKTHALHLNKLYKSISKKI